MRAMWSRIFTVPVGPRSRRNAILWWERRRVLYNLFVLLFFLVARAIASALGPLGLYSGVDTWAMLVPFIIGFNLAHTLCWIFELILHDAAGLGHAETRRYPPWAFGSALVLTALFLSILPLGLALAKASGSFAVPRFRHATERPNPGVLPGWYELSAFSRDQLISAGAVVPDSCGILLREDGSYVAINPHLPDSSSLPLAPTAIEGPGKWNFTGGEKGPWTIVLMPYSNLSSSQSSVWESFDPPELVILDNEPPHRLRLRLFVRSPFYISYHRLAAQS